MWERIETSPSQSTNQWALDLLTNLFSDVGLPGYNPDADVSYLRKRYSCEGITFLSHVLPDLGSAVLRGIETGQFSCPMGFRRFRNRKWAALPKFLSGLLGHLFAPESGRLELSADCVPAFRAIHQVCSLFSKLRAPADPKKEEQHYLDMLSLDASLPDLTNLDLATKQIVATASDLISQVCEGLDLTNIQPKHGPGAVSTPGVKLYEKQFLVRPLYSRALNEHYPYWEYFHPCCDRLPIIQQDGQVPFGISQGSGGLGRLGIVPRDVRYFRDIDSYIGFWKEARCTRTIAVPKTAKKLRVISAEPIPNMGIQGGQSRAIVQHVERHDLTRGKVNFSTQEINRQLALVSSATGENATLDMSAASDRVSCELVKALFPTRIHTLLCASRTRYTRILWPNGNESFRKLRKFAPMGSGVCFPVESLVFWALAVACLYRDRSSKRLLEDALSSVWTYGDDLVVPSCSAEYVMTALAPLGLVFNTEKSFYQGAFRESCGLDAFCGQDVTPVKVRKHPPQTYENGSNAAAFNEYAEAFRDHGWYAMSECAYFLLEEVFGVLPYRLPLDNYLGRVCEDLSEWLYANADRTSLRYRGDVLESASIKAWTIQDKKPELPGTGDVGLWYWFSETGGESSFRRFAETRVALRRFKVRKLIG